VQSAIITYRDCLLHDMGASHPQCLARLSAIRDQLIASRLYGHLLHGDAPLVTDDPLARVHSRCYIAAIKAAAPNSGTIALDSDTPMNPHTPGYSLSALARSIAAHVRRTSRCWRASDALPDALG
jgi:acetoin utilization deacetylase AcuC-like enzyme